MSLHIWKRIARPPYGVPLGLCILIQGVLMAVISPLLPIVIANQIGLDKQEVTAFFLMTTFAGTVVMLGTGYLSDGAIARHKLVLVSGVSGALGMLGIAAATQAIHAYIAGAISVAVGVMFPQLFAAARAGVLADWEREAQVVGITALRTLFSFGFILGTGLASLLARGADIQAAFYLVAGASLALTVYAALVLYRVEGYIAQRATRPRDDQLPATGSVILPIYALVAPLIALIIMQGAQSTRHLFLPLVMFQLFNDASIAPLMFGLTAAAELVTMGLLGYVASKIGEKTTISIGALTGALYFFIQAFTQSRPYSILPISCSPCSSQRCMAWQWLTFSGCLLTVQGWAVRCIWRCSTLGRSSGLSRRFW